MAKTLMIQGTMSSAGKSFIVAGLLRVMKQDGFKVAPFKSQNMALNSFVTKDGFEIGRAQAMQAEAAGVLPCVNMNPILLKPTTDMGSQVILQGKPIGSMAAADYFKMKKSLIPQIMESFNALSNEYDIIVIEGAGSPAEINLKADDIVNMGMAKLADSPVLLAGDIDRGGVFAQLYGTVELLEEYEKERIKGVIINKFRGDKEILKPGLKMLEDKVNKQILGVIPYIDVDIDDEDSLSLSQKKKKQGAIDIAVIQLPKISNFTDFNSLMSMKNVSVRYVKNISQLGSPHLIIIPGTKSTMEDLKWLRKTGLEKLIKHHAMEGVLIFGICGGFQMLGEKISDPFAVEGYGEIEGMGLLPVETVFSKEKETRQVKGRIGEVSNEFSFLNNCEFSGYEIHMGKTIVSGRGFSLINEKNDGACLKNVAGTYVHGIFDNGEIAKKLFDGLCEKNKIEAETESFDYIKYKENQYDILADCIRKNMDMEKIYEIIGVKR